MQEKVIILAAGKSSRFYPFNIRHKSFFEIGGQSILEYTIKDVLKADPEEIIIVLNEESAGKSPEILNKITSLPKTRIVYQKEALGMADAIIEGSRGIHGNFFVINAQHFNFSAVYKKFLEKADGKYSVLLGCTKTDQPEKYGILAFNEGEVSGLTEKPDPGSAPSDKRVLGIYYLTPDFLQEIAGSPISEYLLEDKINSLAKAGKVRAVELTEVSATLKYPWDLLTIKDMVIFNMDFKINPKATVEKTAVLKGDEIYIEEGVRVCDFAIIESPAYIGKNAVVGAYCQLRGGSVLEEDAQIERYVDVRNSLIGKNTHIHSGFIGDSLIGSDVRIGAGFVTANKRLDRKTIKTTVKSEKTETERTGLGVIIGDSVKTGINVSTMPGVIIGNDSIIGPNTSVTKNIDDHTLFYTEFKTTVLKNNE